MKILRFKKGGSVATGILEDNRVTEVISTVPAIFESSLEVEEVTSHKLEEVKVLAPVCPSKIVCVGLNYRDHAEELRMEIPDEPIIFLKPATSIIGHLDNIVYPPSSRELHYEVELAAIISQKAHNVMEKDALEFVGGFTVLNDITARDLQRKDVQWTRAKSFDTFCPIGPYIETELDPSHEKIALKVNDNIKQDSSTENMIFSVEELIEFISSIMTLQPGDLIATGTPPGVGPLQKGDLVEATVQNIGTLKNRIV